MFGKLAVHKRPNFRTKVLIWYKNLYALHIFNELLSSNSLHCVSEKTTLEKNDTDVTHYRFNPHQPISVIFGRDVAEGVCY